MMITGIVDARHDGHAHKILMDLVNEGILDSFELTGFTAEKEDADNYGAYVDMDGYLNLAEDYSTPLSESIYQEGILHIFEAEYLGA